MSDNKTSSMLQRLPVILAVTAASYGLQLPVNAKPAATPKAQANATAQPVARRDLADTAA